MGITNPLPLLGDSVSVVLINLEDSLVDKPSTYIGNVFIGDKGLSANCNYDQEIEELKRIARTNGANLVKIISHKIPDHWSTCDRIRADLYFATDTHSYENEFDWSEKRRLAWRDFRKLAKLSDDTTVAAYTFCGIRYQYHVLSVFSKPYFSVRAFFRCPSSWVRPDQKNRPELLAHEQGHFDLCEIYARQLRKRLKETKFNFLNLPEEAHSIYKEVYIKYSLRQQEYDSNTNHGLRVKIQHDWQEPIEKELAGLNDFAEKIN